MDLTTIKQRLENRFYRQKAALRYVSRLSHSKQTSADPTLFTEITICKVLPDRALISRIIHSSGCNVDQDQRRIVQCGWVHDRHGRLHGRSDSDLVRRRS